MPFSVIFFFMAEQRFRPVILLTASLIFYLLGRPSSVEIIISLVVVNFGLGRWIEAWRSTPRGRIALLVGIVGDLTVLVLSKLFSAYSPAIVVGFVKNLLPIFIQGWLLNLVFPIGLSYITFQVISYLVDVYKGTCASEKNFLQFCLYIFFFPKILTGPITLYRSVRDQLSNPSREVQNVANGLRRFAVGLA